MILVINKSRKNGNRTVDIFKYMGIVARAETPDSALSEISIIYRCVLIMNPYEFPDERDYIKTLRSYSGRIPVFALSDRPLYDESIYDMVFPDNITSSRLYRCILAYCDKHKLPPVGEYNLAGIDASVYLRGITYFNDVLPLTKTESMILRLLIRTHPTQMSPKRILKYAFSQSKRPEESSIRTHISSINKKFRAICGRNLIISGDSHGYVILTPVMMARSLEEALIK